MTTEATVTSSLTVPNSIFERPATTFTHDDSTFHLPPANFTVPAIEAEQVGSTLSLLATTIELPAVKVTLSDNEESQDSNNDCSGSLSSAEAAGIGIGSALGGIALATAAIALYIRFFKRRPRPLPPWKPRGEPTNTNRSRFDVPASNDRFAGARRNAVDDLPQRKGDNEYQQQVERLKTGIKNCVEAFFAVPHTLEDEHKAPIQRLIGGNPQSLTLIDGLSSRSSYKRSCAIRALLAQLIFDRIDPRAETTTPLLPPALFAVYRSLRTSPAQGRRARSRSIGNESDRHELIQTWRQITGAYMPRDLLRQQARLAVEDMALSLGPLRPSPQGDFEEVLHDLGIQAASLGLALFTIPEQWSPVWTPRTTHPNGHLVVFPGVEFHGQGSEARRQLTEPYLE